MFQFVQPKPESVQGICPNLKFIIITNRYPGIHENHLFNGGKRPQKTFKNEEAPLIKLETNSKQDNQISLMPAEPAHNSLMPPMSQKSAT